MCFCSLLRPKGFREGLWADLCFFGTMAALKTGRGCLTLSFGVFIFSLVFFCIFLFSQSVVRERKTEARDGQKKREGVGIMLQYSSNQKSSQGPSYTNEYKKKVQ